jgi:hypothetical protein
MDLRIGFIDEAGDKTRGGAYSEILLRPPL